MNVMQTIHYETMLNNEKIVHQSIFLKIEVTLISILSIKHLIFTLCNWLCKTALKFWYINWLQDGLVTFHHWNEDLLLNYWAVYQRMTPLRLSLKKRTSSLAIYYRDVVR